MSKAAEGTLWVDTATGDAYRLVESFANEESPFYVILTEDGGVTTSKEDPSRQDLPETCEMVWDPEGDGADEATMKRLGFEKRYHLCGHPAYPDPMSIWPATEERATEIWNSYCKSTFEEYIAAIGHTPRRFGGTPYTAETFNPRILITWEYKGDREVFVPEGEKR